MKPQFKPRGSVAKEEEPKPSHQLYKQQVKPTGSAGQICGMCKRSLRAPMEENTLVLTAVDMEARTHRSRTRLESELPPQQVQRPAQC